MDSEGAQAVSDLAAPGTTWIPTPRSCAPAGCRGPGTTCLTIAVRWPSAGCRLTVLVLAKASGAMATGWVKVGDSWYYSVLPGDVNGQQHTINGRTYVFTGRVDQVIYVGVRQTRASNVVL